MPKVKAGRVIHMGEKYPAAYDQGYAHGVEDATEGKQSVYTHRNGETQPPTVMGKFWFEGKIHHRDQGYYHEGRRMLDVDTHWRTDELCIPGEECIHALEDAEGQWWGPIVPPWEQTA